MGHDGRMEVLTYEAERGYVDFKPLTYSRQWSDTTKRGQNVLQADVSRVSFSVKTPLSAASPFISLGRARGALARADPVPAPRAVVVGLF